MTFSIISIVRKLIHWNARYLYLAEPLWGVGSTITGITSVSPACSSTASTLDAETREPRA